MIDEDINNLEYHKKENFQEISSKQKKKEKITKDWKNFFGESERPCGHLMPGKWKSVFLCESGQVTIPVEKCPEENKKYWINFNEKGQLIFLKKRQ